MANTTGKLDKLIEEKVDQKIRDFAKSISDQVREFIKENGDPYGSDHMYQADSFIVRNSCYEATGFSHRPINNIYKNIKGGLDLSIKDKMITRETKDLLSKVSLLS
jgi:hypothetical protein